MNIEKDDGIFFSDNHLLAEGKELNYIIPIRTVSSIIPAIIEPENYFLLRKQASRNIFAVYLPLTECPAEFVWRPVREALIAAETEAATFILRGKQLLNWHRSSRYCGRCGAMTLISDSETAKVCSVCHLMLFPYSYSAIMLLIWHQDKILLARSPHFAKGMYSTLAGFIEAGESCEEAIIREVYEEVGLTVKNITYFGSQPWPFPSSFMLAFKAEYDSGSICFNDKEIEDAKWFTKDNLPQLPLRSSISRLLIDSFINQHEVK